MPDENLGKVKTPTGAKLPGVPLATALTVAAAAAELAAPSSKERIASQAGASIGGSFATKFGAANFFGLLTKAADGRYGVSDRGERALAGDQHAKREAVMGTGFGPVIRLLSSRPVVDSAIEGRLEEDFGVPNSSVKKRKDVLLASAEEAGLIQDGKFDPEAIESVSIEQPAASDASKKSKRPTKPQPKPAIKQEEPLIRETVEPIDRDRAGHGVQVVLNIDASKLSPQDLGDLIRELRKSEPSDE